MRCWRRWLELKRFLIALSVRPGSRFTISDHRVPSSATPSAMSWSSSSVHSPFLTAGQRWLNQRSRHCLPTRPVMCEAMRDQRCAPNLVTVSISCLSSASVHARFALTTLAAAAAAARGGARGGEGCCVRLELGEVHVVVTREVEADGTLLDHVRRRRCGHRGGDSCHWALAPPPPADATSGLGGGLAVGVTTCAVGTWAGIADTATTSAVGVSAAFGAASATTTSAIG